MRAQVIANSEIVTPEAAIPLDYGYVRGVISPSTRVLTTRNPGFSKVFVLKILNHLTIREGHRPRGKSHDNVDDWLATKWLSVGNPMGKAR